MSILMMVVGFDEDPPTDLNDILGYAAFDPNAAGQNLWGKINTYTYDTEVEGVRIVIVKYLDEKIHSSYLSMIFKDAIPPEREKDELLTKRRVQQVKDVMAELVFRLKLTPEYTYDAYNFEDMSAFVFKDAAPILDAFIARDERKTFAIVSDPPKE